MNKKGELSEISSETLRNLILFLIFVLAIAGIVYLIVTRLLNV